MSRQQLAKTAPGGQHVSGKETRARLLEPVPAAEGTLELAGVRTPVLEGGEGSPVVILHGLGQFAAQPPGHAWFPG